MIVQLIHNPASGTHHELRLDVLAQAFQACGAKVVKGHTTKEGRVDIAPNADLICVSGGDGTLRLVIAAMQAKEIGRPICIFPAGTVNLVAREIGYSSAPETFASEVMQGYLAGETARLKEPVVASNYGPFVACLSAGPDGLAVANHSPALKQKIGRSAYGLSFVQLFFQWIRPSFTIAISHMNEARQDHRCEAFYIAKGRYFAGPWRLTPEAGLGRDYFHVILLKTATRWNFIRFMLSIARGKNPENLSFVESYQARSITINSTAGEDNILYFQEDGDSMPAMPTTVKMTDYVAEYCLPFSEDSAA
ncbi:MAG: diacylglycerol kinase family protein [Parasphingorhabdus sp.]|uniref:diacylglycerol/lipid kinase family protein n=1 Tax=Parasphingorhabdus sp. TaxID=2709688 RepID=UPI0032996CA8